MELFLDSTWQSDFLLILLNYTRLNQQNRVKAIRLSPAIISLIQKGDQIKFPGIPCLITEDSQCLFNVNKIANYLCQISFTKQIFYGIDDDEKSDINAAFQQVFKIQEEVLLAEVNKHLETRTFFATNHINIADLAFFGRVYRHMVIMQDEQKFELYHLFRWYNFIQNLPELSKILAAIGFSKSLFPQQPEVQEEKKKKKNENKGGDPLLRQQAEEKKKQLIEQGGLEIEQKPAKKTEQKTEKQQVENEQKPTQQNEKKPAQQNEKKPAEAKQNEKKQPEQKNEQKIEKQPQTKQEKPQAEKKPQTQPAAEKKTEAEEKATPEEFAQLDLRVGNIIECWKHPESENLYCEKIDMGNGEIRQIASGLQKFVQIEDMKGLCIVAYNLKARKVANFESFGMVICASNSDKTKVEVLRPAPGTQIGERVVVSGFENLYSQTPQPQLNPKKKILEKCFPTMHTDDKCNATYLGNIWKTSTGVVTAQTITNGTIS